MNELTSKDARDFERLDKAIRRRAAAVKRFWLDLVEVHDRRLYRKRFDSFESYLESIPGVGRIRGYQLLNAGRVSMEYPITTERQARVLGNLPKEISDMVWREGVSRFGSQPNGGQLKKILAEKVSKAEAQAGQETKRPALPRTPADRKEIIEGLIARARREHSGLANAEQGEAILLSYLNWLRAVV